MTSQHFQILLKNVLKLKETLDFGVIQSPEINAFSSPFIDHRRKWQPYCKMCQRGEITTVNCILHEQVKSPSKIHAKIETTYSENALRKCRVYHRCKLIEDGHTDLQNEPKARCYLSPKTKENPYCNDDLIHDQKRLKICDIAKFPDFSKSKIHML